MKRRKNNIYNAALSLLVPVLFNSCIDKYVPESLDAFDKDAAFTTTMYHPVLGRTNVISNNFSSGNSTQPLTFTLTNVTHKDGTPAPELTESFPVRIWKTPYSGTEKSLAEINAKRGYENRSLLQVRQHSGEIILWENALSSFVKCSPDSGYVFNVKVENSGGWREYTGLRLVPYREQDFETDDLSASEDNNGIVTQDYVHPSNVTNMYKENNTSYFGLIQPEDVRVYFREIKDATTSAPSLTFRFMTQDYNTINPKKFSGTDWNNLVHGFNMKVTDEYVRYDVAYPIPLNTLPSKYTNANGTKAHVVFKYDRLMYGTRRVTASMDLNFAIYKEGHWEIVFVFTGGNPEFRDNY